MKKSFLLIVSLFIFANSMHADAQEVNAYNPSQYCEHIQATIKLFFINDALDCNSVMIDLIKADKDQAVHGILLVIDNCGGTIAQFGTLHDLIKKISNKKPIIAFVNGDACSGGYLLTCAANYIVSGSLSQLGGIGVFKEIWKYKEPYVSGNVTAKLSVELFQCGEYKNIYNFYKELSDKDRKYIQDGIDRNYKQFITMVAKNRSLKTDDYTTWAEGKCFDAEQALKLRLIDGIGTMLDAEAKLLELIRKKNPKLKFGGRVAYKND